MSFTLLYLTYFFSPLFIPALLSHSFPPPSPSHGTPLIRTHTLSQELTKLTIINLSCNQFSQFPKEAFMSKALVEVDLSTNKVDQSFRKP